MSLGIAALSMDAFRITYQGIESGFQSPLGQNTTLAEQIYRKIKNHVMLADTVLTTAQHLGAESLDKYIVPFRAASIAQGLYLLETDSDADGKALKLDICLNLLNISHTALSALSKWVSSGPFQQFLTYASLGCQAGDIALRLKEIVTNRTALLDRADAVRQKGVVSHLSDIGDVIARVTIGSLISLGAYLRSADLLRTMEIGVKDIYTVLAFGTAALGTHLLIKDAVNKIFDDHNFFQGDSRKLAAWSISAVSSVTLSSAAAVGFGYASSLSAIMKPIYTVGAPIAIASALTYLFATALDKIGTDLQLPDSIVGSLGKWTFSIVSATVLTSAAAVGLGMAQAMSDFWLRTLQVGMIGIASLFLASPVIMAGSTLLSGAPSWDDIDHMGKFLLIR